MALKRDKRDILFSALVRERADWTCEICGKSYHHDHHGLHCSHIFSRRARSIRWHPDAAAAHCYSCHLWFGSNPILGGEWAKQHLSTAKIEDLKRRFNTPMKFSKRDLEDIDQRLKIAYEVVVSKRESGEHGRIEFGNPYADE